MTDKQVNVVKRLAKYLEANQLDKIERTLRRQNQEDLKQIIPAFVEYNLLLLQESIDEAIKPENEFYEQAADLKKCMERIEAIGKKISDLNDLENE